MIDQFRGANDTPPCSQCGSIMVRVPRRGSTAKCLNCGHEVAIVSKAEIEINDQSTEKKTISANTANAMAQKWYKVHGFPADIRPAPGILHDSWVVHPLDESVAPVLYVYFDGTVSTERH